MADWQRTHTCGELRVDHVGQRVTLNGWVNTTREYPDQVFVDLRDRYGLTQVVFEKDSALFQAAQEIRGEWVLSVTGTVRARLEGKKNTKIASGEVEVEASTLQILNRCPVPKFQVHSIPQDDGTLNDPELANEDLRLQWRYLDLRRPKLQRTLAMRHRLNKVIRDHLDTQGFLELETPLLGRSTPEGARDYLVPSRVHPGSWYALPQSPQIYKQLLMVSGYDKYFQIARCLRDEDLRADRQPEFTQLDLEMSFVEMDDVFAVVEGLTVDIFQRCLGVKIPQPLPRICYEDAMAWYGSDKPDLRYGLKIQEFTDLFTTTELLPFQEALKAGGRVRGILVPGVAEQFSRKQLDELDQAARRSQARLLAWVKYESDKFTSSIGKFISSELGGLLRQRSQAKPGDLLLLGAADSEDATATTLGTLRSQLASRLELVDPSKKEFQIAWIIDFPSFLWDAEENRWVANHHPFTAPQDRYLDVLRNATEEDLSRPDSPLAQVKAKAYDLVINGYECAGGSIRIHNREVQRDLFRMLGMTDEQARSRFGFLLDALEYGAPPHGGIAFGLDRWAMMLAGTTNIRDVIAFPKNQQARDLMTGAPAPVDARQIRELDLAAELRKLGL